MMLPSRLDCPLSRKTPNMGNTGQHETTYHRESSGNRAAGGTAAVGLGRQGPEQTVRSSPQRETGDETRHALEIATSVAQIGDFSDLVVRGSVVSSTTVEKRPAVETSDAYTPAAKIRYADLVVNIDKITFRVDEYYKGAGSDEITIMADPEVRTLEPGVTYVLFLSQSPTAECQ